MTIIVDNPSPKVAPSATCPPWCCLPSDHDSGPEAVADGERFVHHAGPVLADAGGFRLDVGQTIVVLPDGTTEAEPPVVVLDGHEDRPLRADQARHLAAALALSAELLAGGVR